MEMVAHETGSPLLLMSLVGGAYRRYINELRAELAAEGFEDLPAGGARALVILARREHRPSAVADHLKISRQAASQLIDVLVERGYCGRSTDQADRRRLVLVLTDRGREAAGAIRRLALGREQLLEEAMGSEAVAVVRAALGTLAGAGQGR